MSKPLIYVIGSLRNPRVPEVAKLLRDAGYEIFDDWYAVGPKADDHWQEYEQSRGRSYKDALWGEAARNTYEFDRRHLAVCAGVVMVAPAGKSAHLELGHEIGKGKPAWVLMEQDPERWDVMMQFVFETGGRLCDSEADLVNALDRYFNGSIPF